MRAVISRCCFVCRRLVEEDHSGDLWPWLVEVLDAAVLPCRHDGGFGVTDLRPRWPAPAARSLYDLDNLPRDLTLEEVDALPRSCMLHTAKGSLHFGLQAYLDRREIRLLLGQIPASGEGRSES